MPITSRVFVRSTIALLVVALVALLGIVGTTIWLSERSQIIANSITEAINARRAVVDLRNDLQVAETSQRGFLITGRDEYLTSYPNARDRAQADFKRVQAALQPYTEADVAVSHLQQAVTQKFSEMDQTISLRRTGQNDEATKIVQTDQGKALMDEAQQLFTAVIDASDKNMSVSIAEQRTNSAALRWVTIIGGIVIVLVVAGSALTVIRYTRELVDAREEVTTLNSSLEERVAERTADLARANEEIQRFAYIVTHDLRAPLVNIMGFTSELETSVGLIKDAVAVSPPSDDPTVRDARLAATEDLPEAIGFIRSSTKKMDGLINAILKLSREGRRVLKPERVDVAELLRNGAASIAHQVVEADGEVNLDIQIPAIRTDRLSVEQIFGNLLDNAVKYRAKGRPLRIDVHGTVLGSQRVAIEVTDNGRGIADTDLERVFELFRRSGQQDQPGEGIGLAFVRAVVRNIGGDITVKSKLGEGTTFRVVLPRALQTQGS